MDEVRNGVANVNEKVRELERNVSDEIKDMNDRMAIIECGQENIVQDQMNTDETMASIADQMHKLEDEIDRQEQYSRRENLLFHNTPTSDNENYPLSFVPGSVRCSSALWLYHLCDIFKIYTEVRHLKPPKYDYE